jgi:glycine cleavage system H protein
MNPEELLYAETHEWVHVAAEGGRKVGTIGITAFAVQQLTDLVFMELPKVGAMVAAGKEFGEVESVKAVSPLYSPVSGEVVAVNVRLTSRKENGKEISPEFELLSNDPFGDGWMIKVALSDEAELKKLMNKAAYEKQCADHG